MIYVTLSLPLLCFFWNKKLREPWEHGRVWCRDGGGGGRHEHAAKLPFQGIHSKPSSAHSPEPHLGDLHPFPNSKKVSLQKVLALISSECPVAESYGLKPFPVSLSCHSPSGQISKPIPSSCASPFPRGHWVGSRQLSVCTREKVARC